VRSWASARTRPILVTDHGWRDLDDPGAGVIAGLMGLAFVCPLHAQSRTPYLALATFAIPLAFIGLKNFAIYRRHRRQDDAAFHPSSASTRTRRLALRRLWLASAMPRSPR
jgi:hypothetical protein